MTEKHNDFKVLLDEYNKLHDNAVEIKYNEPMSRHTTFRIGGVADFYLIPQNITALVDLCRIIKTADVKHYFLGNGSNVLFDDEGYRGAVVSLSALTGIEVKTEANTITAQSGLSLMTLCKTARDNSMSGLEFAYGIPGSVGGAVYMNAGAYGGEISAVLTESTYLDPETLDLHSIGRDEHNFGYRDSVYQHNNRIIVSASFKLNQGDIGEISAQMNDYMERRRSKQPLEYPSAGSVFRRYPGRYTGQMIEECGLKGCRIGGAQVSEKHAGFIINLGDAKSSDVLELVEYIKEKVYEKFGCRIECELIQVK